MANDNWLFGEDSDGIIIAPAPLSPKIQFDNCVLARGNSEAIQNACMKEVLESLILAERVAQQQYSELVLMLPDQKDTIYEIYTDEVDHEKKLTKINSLSKYRLADWRLFASRTINYPLAIMP